jgi:glycosyltransferase involved in cell wall biosynthesis
MAVTNDLVTDRRVMRHVETLREAGYAVTLIGKNDLRVRNKKTWKFYAEYNLRLWWRLLRSKCDVVWANDTDTLLACFLAARMKRKRLVMDAHELFPEVPELVGREKVKRVWERIERRIMPKCDALLTVCQSIADYYRERYGVQMAVVRNVPLMEHSESKPTISAHRSPFTLLYQGAVNVGRGVDWAIDALEWLDGCRLVIAGGGDLLDQMKAYAAQKPWADRIEFLGRLTPDQLQPLTRQADVGLVMLEDMGLNYHYALPNRIGDFVAAGVPIVVSDLPEMAAVVRRFNIGEVIEGTGARPLAQAVGKVLAKDWHDADFAEARKDMDWNKEKQKLIEIINKI